jgi:hypothetical protein
MQLYLLGDVMWIVLDLFFIGYNLGPNKNMTNDG